MELKEETIEKIIDVLQEAGLSKSREFPVRVNWLVLSCLPRLSNWSWTALCLPFGLRLRGIITTAQNTRASTT